MKVLFIAGYGRSGSTLLEQVLAKDATFVSIGEVRNLWQRGYLSDTLCGCGEPFRDCAFWRSVDQSAFGELSSAAARRMTKIRKALYRPWQLPRALAHSRRGHRPGRDDDLDAYVRHLEAVYRAALSSSRGASIVIDSSKDALHGLLIAGMKDVSLHVVHLVRDARGVAFSWSRPKIRPEVHWREQFMDTRGPVRSAVEWAYQNALAVRLKSRAASYRLVRYEDFVLFPEEVLDRIRTDVGLAAPPEPMVRDHRVVLPLTHSISGNPSRFERRDVPLRLDERWRSGMSRLDRRTVTLLASPLLFRYGYLSPGRSEALRRAGS